MAYMNATITPLPKFTPDNWDAEVGARIKVLLVNRGTQDDIAKAIGLQQADVSKRLNGRVHWKAQELALVAQLFDVPVGYLYGEPMRKGPTPTGTGPKLLPEVDSNHQPAGFKSAAPTLATVTPIRGKLLAQ